jgi:sugar/nucleoside kinase (ribokinase family)
MYHGEEVEVMDVVGAGDSFLAGFSHMYVKSKDPEKSIKFGNLIAANAVKQRGVVNKINIKDIYDKIK